MREISTAILSAIDPTTREAQNCSIGQLYNPQYLFGPIIKSITGKSTLQDLAEQQQSMVPEKLDMFTMHLPFDYDHEPFMIGESCSCIMLDNPVNAVKSFITTLTGQV